MGKQFLDKIRKLNWVLSESTTGNLSYVDLSGILCQIMSANIYILDNQGRVLGTAYNYKSDSSTIENVLGVETVPAKDNENFLEIKQTKANLIREELIPILGDTYDQLDKYHTIIPCFCGGQRLGTLVFAKYAEIFSDEDIALGEYGATVVGLEIQRNLQLVRARERNLRMTVELAMETLSCSEKDAIERIVSVLEEQEGIIIASKVASQYKIANSVIVSALKKMESAGILETKSLGMKGTYIKICNPYFRMNTIK